MGGLVTAATAAGDGGGGSIGGFLIPLLLVLAVVYIFSMQRRRTRSQQQEVSRIVPGTLVMTTAGLYATVVEIDDGDILLEIAPDVVCRFSRSAIARAISAPEQDSATDDHDAGDEPDAVAAEGTSVAEADDAKAGGGSGPSGTDTDTGTGTAEAADPDAGTPGPPRKEL
ncbi:preprotein translocase subunit YajC [Frankia sp. AiPs1]|uniref:preprotein translocase subunit YajC n=1 Tax=Frankia sp. AiPa1 TaxID=573492 RepID=UPI00202B501F|nr:preprotein translocase subunit YajC [Frankia sp. AiPa1]MCL9758004.1 preprotein translocase subunit YajC [Frankia sp. AiPa1]